MVDLERAFLASPLQQCTATRRTTARRNSRGSACLNLMRLLLMLALLMTFKTTNHPRLIQTLIMAHSIRRLELTSRWVACCRTGRRSWFSTAAPATARWHHCC